MKNFLKNLKIKHTSNTPNILAMQPLSKPVFTPRCYEQLADEGYQRNVIVFRCVNLIARGLGSVPWLLYKKSHSNEEEIEQHPLLSLLNCPSPYQAGSAFMESVVGHLLLSGNAYIEAIMNTRNQIQELYALRPDRMRIVAGASGIEGYEYTVGSHRKRYEVDTITGKSQILHIKLFTHYMIGMD